MLSAFFESIKYVGHQFPIAFLRIYLGYYWFHRALAEYQDGLFTSQIFADNLQATEFLQTMPQWYQWLATHVFFPYWPFVSQVVLILSILVGLSLILGFFVRFFATIGVFICLHFIWYGYEEQLYAVFFAILITLIIAGAGRCVGLDYYFYKRNRGLWW